MVERTTFLYANQPQSRPVPLIEAARALAAYWHRLSDRAKEGAFGLDPSTGVTLAPYAIGRFRPHGESVFPWRYLISEDLTEAQKSSYQRAVEVLARHRGGREALSPLEVPKHPFRWPTWLEENIPSLDHVLILGGPTEIPFAFQSLLDTLVPVGRVDLGLDELADYAKRVVISENSERQPGEPVVFATGREKLKKGEQTDTDYFMLNDLARPIADHLPLHNIQPQRLFGSNATAAKLIQKCRKAKNTVVFTVTHGDEWGSRDVEVQKRFMGGIICDDRIVFGEDLAKTNGPLADQSVWFHYGCYGYGTPEVSSYGSWTRPDRSRMVIAKEPFVADIPKRLLALDNGPLAFIGHLDIAYIPGLDPLASARGRNPGKMTRVSSRVRPYVFVIDELINGRTVGESMVHLNRRATFLSSSLLTMTDEFLDATGSAHESIDWMVESFILRMDALNYMVFGDPAVRLPKSGR